jgi:hypothetical protein
MKFESSVFDWNLDLSVNAWLLGTHSCGNSVNVSLIGNGTTAQRLLAARW